MNTKQLRQKILDLAIHGKLVPQDPNDESASVLLERIRAEKERLIKEGKIKRDKKDSLRDKSNYGQFEIPDSWAWANLGSVCNLSNGIAKRKADSGNSTVVLRLADLGDEKINLSSPRYINLSDGEVAQYKLNKGDLVFVRVNGNKQNVGKTFVFDNDTVVAYCDHLMRGRPDNRVDSCYLSYALRSTVCRATIDGLIVTTAGQNTISQGSLSSIPIPLPPLPEQHRIVTAINAAFTVIDEIERSKADLQAAITLAKQKILSLAIQASWSRRTRTTSLLRRCWSA
jgi:type I restriction enzyme S subunit